MSNPTITIIIVTYNSSEYIEQCLTSVFKNSYSNYKVLIVDNNSQDTTIDIVNTFRSKKISIIKNTDNLGFAKANNIGVQHTKSDYIFFLNPDTIVEKNFLKPLVTIFKTKKNVGIAQPHVLLFDKETTNLSGKTTHFLGLDWVRGYGKKASTTLEEIYSCSGSAMLVKRSDFLQLGGFDDAYFMYYEDTDLSLKYLFSGKKMYFVPQSKVFHDYKYDPVETYQPKKQKLFYIERNRILTYLKLYSWKVYLLQTPLFIMFELGILALSLIEGWFFTKLKSYFSALTMIPHVLQERKAISEYSQSCDTQLLSLFTGSITFEKFGNRKIFSILNPFMETYKKVILKLL